MERCRRERPELRAVPGQPDRRVRCFLYDDAAPADTATATADAATATADATTAATATTAGDETTTTADGKGE
jgi:hypothetical protein